MTRVVHRSKKTKYMVKVLIRKEIIQHVVLADSDEEIHERIDCAYAGQGIVYSIDRQRCDLRTSSGYNAPKRNTSYEPFIWNE